jgi:hypothetical protein
MSPYLAVTSEDQASAIAGARAVVCPVCDVLLTFFRTSVPHIDECGFESYRFECKECGTPLAGIVDPADEALLLSVSTS